MPDFASMTKIMSTLKFQLLGKPKIFLDGQPLLELKSVKARALLYFLATTHQAHSRSKLAGMLWGDLNEDSARNNLRNALSLQLKGNDLDRFLHVDHLSIGLKFSASLQIDLLEFDANLRSTQPTVAQLQTALACYQGEFLEDFNLDQAPEFSEWMLQQRVRLHEQAIRAGGRLAGHYIENGQLAEALQCVERVLSWEPLDEQANQAKILTLAWLGRPGEAQETYDRFAQQYEDEFGDEPPKELRTLYVQIKRGEIKGAPTKGIGQKIDSQLRGLTDLIRSPTVQATRVAFHTDFAAASEHIQLLGNYKDLHDLLHNLEFLCYNGIVKEAPRFPQDETALSILTDHELTLQVLVEGLQRVASRMSALTTETIWIAEVVEAQSKLHAAIHTGDTNALGRTIWLLGRVLYRQPTRVNERLNTAASTLRLTAIIGTLESIVTKLRELAIEENRLQQFAEGIVSLKALNQKLNATVDEHARWQAVDLEFRRIESMVSQDLQELYQSWPSLQVLVEPLLHNGKAEWVQRFTGDYQNLNDTLITQNPAKIRLCFQRFRRQASQRFYQIDSELKNLCHELRQIGTSLVSILEVLENVNGHS